uniref:AIG1-type G domain-containing protein n=1 Tax=Nothobranchius furzeri TaxID=105023 RepID=A0A8C6NZ16_NOTFU
RRRGGNSSLEALTKLFGPSAVSRNTVVLFTHTEELGEDEQLEEYLVTWRKDLLALVARCGDRYHTLESRGGEPEEKRAVEELLEKVEQALKENVIFCLAPCHPLTVYRLLLAHYVKCHFYIQPISGWESVVVVSWFGLYTKHT